MRLAATITLAYCIYRHLAICIADVIPSTPFDPIVEPCDPSKSLLDPITHRFRSGCELRQWCKPTSTFESDPLLTMPTVVLPSISERDVTSPPPSVPSPMPSPVPNGSLMPIDFGLCVNKTCRRDEYPFGYRGVPFEELPKMCDLSEYCPDDGSQCEPLIALGGPCQLNRDDSCQKVPSTYDEVLCLQGFCRLASARFQQHCLIDSTDYVGYNESGSQIIATVIRDDCQRGLYCDQTTSTCFQEKTIDMSCSENRECIEFNCDIISQTCQAAPQRLHLIPIWLWCVITISIPTILVVIVIVLYQMHQRHRAIRLEEIDQFFSEQWQYRQAILGMHAAANQAMTRNNSIASSSHQQQYQAETSNTYPSEKIDHHQDQSYTSSLNSKGSPTSSYQYKESSLSPRIPHQRTPSSS